MRKDVMYALTTSEEVMEDNNDGEGEVTIYEADGMGAVSDCLGCNFFRGDLGYSVDEGAHNFL